MDQTPNLVGESKPTKATKLGKMKSNRLWLFGFHHYIVAGLAPTHMYMLCATLCYAVVVLHQQNLLFLLLL